MEVGHLQRTAMDNFMHILPAEKVRMYEEMMLEAQMRELREKIMSSPQVFLWSGHVYTNDPHHHPSKRLFPDLPYLRELIWRMETEQMLFVEKSRQMMATNAAMGFAYWYAASQPGRQCYVRAERREQAIDILQRCRFIHINLPEWLRPDIALGDLDKQDKSKLVFANGSFIQALSSGPHKIRSTTASLIVDDEVAFWGDYMESFAAAMPSVEGGGKLFALTTAYPGHADDLCHDRA